jgi:hypothetical protein
LRRRIFPHLVTLVALSIGGGLAVSILAAPLERLIVIVPDDAFYYLQIARNLIATGRSTADGFSATNGYHPLWLAVTTTLAAVFADRELLLRAAVGVSLVLHLVASWLVGVRVAQVAGRAWGRAAALCWLLNRVALVIALQAMESTLYIVVLLIALGVHLRLAATLTAGASPSHETPPRESPLRESPPRRLLVFYGVSLGFAILARTEGAAVAAIALVWLGVRLWRAAGRQTAGRHAAGRQIAGRQTAGRRTHTAQAAISWAICAAAVLAIVLPWMLFSLWQVGTIQQDSGVMKALWANDHFPDAVSRVRNVFDTADYFLRHTVRLMWYSLPSIVLTLVPIAIAAVFAAVQMFRPRGRVAIVMRAAVVPAVIVVGIYGVTLVDRQIWWMGLPWLSIFLTAMLGAVWLCRAIPALRQRQRLVRGAMVAVSMISVIALARSPLAPYPWQADVLRSQAIVERSIPRDHRIGCFNAGIPLYFGTGRIVALDGLVSHAALGYWSERRLDDYVRDAGVRFIADDPPTMERAQRFTRTPLRLEEQQTFPLRGWPTESRVLWAVGAEAEPETEAR